MSGSTTTRLISAYNQSAEPTRFFSGFFRSPPQNFHNSQEIEIDIQRSGEDVAIVVQDITTGYRLNSNDIYTNKGFTPPVFKEAGPINVFDAMKRVAGNDPFQDVNFQANVILKSFDLFRKLERKIRRAMELMASQVMQTGMITAIDNAGTQLYVLNFQPKATHFPTAAIPWGQANATPVDDIASLGTVIRTDGLTRPDTLIFGETAFEEFIKDANVQLRLGKDNIRIDMGAVAPQTRGEGATFMGFIWIRSYRYSMWTYDGRYKDPQTGVSTPFMHPQKVVVMDSQARLDATFGGVPRLVPPDSRVLPFLPDRISNVGSGVDMFTNAWVTADGETLYSGASARPLMIPTAIDTFGCLDTNAGDTA